MAEDKKNLENIPLHFNDDLGVISIKSIRDENERREEKEELRRRKKYKREEKKMVGGQKNRWEKS